MTIMVRKKKSVTREVINHDVPKEEEKIASRRAVRLAGKIKETQERLRLKPFWSGSQVRSFDLVLVWGLNLYLVWPFFGREAFKTSYSGPIIPLLAKMIGWSGLPLAYAIEIVNIGFFLLFPVAFYLFMRRVSGKDLVALLASLVVSLPISPFAGARIQGMFYSVEGPHMASLALVPLAAYGLLSFLHDGGLRNLVLAAGCSVLVGLISPFGLLTYVIFGAIIAFSEMLLGQGRLKIMRLLMVFLLGAGLSSFWYNPGFFFWMLSGPLGVEPKMMFARLLPVSLFTLPILGVIGYLLFDRKPDLQPLFLGSFLTIGFGMIVLVGKGGMMLAPSRYIPELGIALAFLLSTLGERLFEQAVKHKDKWRWGRRGGERWLFGSLLGVIILLVVGILKGRSWMLSYEPGVLGFWTGVERGEIWLARERFGGGYSVMGYGITGMIGMTLWGLKNKRRPR